MSTTQLEIAVRSIEFARSYTLQLLEDVADDEWFWRPHEGVTHIAWQVGHLAMAEYGLTMLRLRGKLPEDASFMNNQFFRTFQKGSTPSESPTAMPSPSEIRDTLDQVHTRALAELRKYTDEQLDVRVPEPYAVFETKLGSLFFCASHEMLHAGQIGLLRRLMGKPKVR